MSIADFMKNAATVAVEVKQEQAGDISTEAFDFATNDIELTKLSVSAEQAYQIRKQVAVFREEIQKGDFTPTPEALHLIVMYYRITREEAFTVVKAKPVKVPKEKKPRAAKKAVPTIEYLM